MEWLIGLKMEWLIGLKVVVQLVLEHWVCSSYYTQ